MLTVLLHSLVKQLIDGAGSLIRRRNLFGASCKQQEQYNIVTSVADGAVVLKVQGCTRLGEFVPDAQAGKQQLFRKAKFHLCFCTLEKLLACSRLQACQEQPRR